MQRMQGDEVQLYGAIARLELSHDFVHSTTTKQDVSMRASTAESARTLAGDETDTIAFLSVENKELQDEHDVSTPRICLSIWCNLHAKPRGCVACCL